MSRAAERLRRPEPSRRALRLGVRLADQRGSAVVEFSLVTVVLLTMVLGLCQLALALHVRNTLVACAAEGARYGANADRGQDDAAAHTTQLITAALADSFAREVSARTTTVDDVAVVEVSVSTVLPVIGLLGPPRSRTVRGHAFDEEAVL